MTKSRKKDVFRRGILAVLLIILFLLQTTPGLFRAVGKAFAMPLVPAVICIGMFERETAGAFFGLFAGLMWDAVSAQPAGYHSLFLMVLGCVSGLLITHLMRNNLLSGCLLGACGILFHGMCYWLFFVAARGYDGALKLLTEKYLPSMLYTAAFIPLFYFIVRILCKQLRNKT